MRKVSEQWEKHLINHQDRAQLWDEFSLRAQNASAEVYRLNSSAEAKLTLLKMVKDLNVKKVVAVECFFTQATGVIQSLRELGVAVYTDPSDIRTHAETAEIGVSGVEFGVAETGSVCQDAFSAESRLVSTLPPIHVAFMNSGNIVPGVEDALNLVSNVFDQGYVSFITGPSRTADIERVLTIGVHGPSRLVILAVDHQDSGSVN